MKVDDLLRVYLNAINGPSNCTTAQLFHPRQTYDWELSHERSAESGDLSISIRFRAPLCHLTVHLHYVTVPDASPGGQQLLLFKHNERRGWNMGLHKEHFSATQPRGIELCNNAIQWYDTCT